MVEYMQIEGALCPCNEEYQKLQNVRKFEDLYLLNFQANYLCGRQAVSARAVI